MVTDWAKVLRWVRETVAGVEPPTDPDRRFRPLDGYLAFGEEPPQTFDRGFVVEAGPGTDGAWYGMQEQRDHVTELHVLIGYHAHLNRAGVEERIGLDRDRIVSALLDRKKHAEGIHHTQYLRSEIDREPSPDDPDRVLSIIRLAVSYRMTW